MVEGNAKFLIRRPTSQPKDKAEAEEQEGGRDEPPPRPSREVAGKQSYGISLTAVMLEVRRRGVGIAPRDGVDMLQGGDGRRGLFA